MKQPKLDRDDVSRVVSPMARARHEVARETGLMEEVEGAGRAAAGATGPKVWREVFGSLYKGERLADVEEPADPRAAAFANAVHNLLEGAPGWDKLQQQCAGSGALAAVATRRLCQGLVDSGELPEIAEDASDEEALDELAEWVEWTQSDPVKVDSLQREAKAAMEGASAEADHADQACRGLFPGKSPAELEASDPGAQAALQLASRVPDGARQLFQALGAMRHRLTEASSRLIAHEGTAPSGVEPVRELRRLLPTERAALVSPHRLQRVAALYRFSTGQALGYETQELRPAERGAFVVCLDASGSMIGQPWLEGRAFALAALMQAAEEGRPVRLVLFNAEAYEVALDFGSAASTLATVSRVAAHRADGGTSFLRAFQRAMAPREGWDTEGADVLFVTDGQDYPNQAEVRRLLGDAELTVLGIGSGCNTASLEAVLGQVARRCVHAGSFNDPAAVEAAARALAERSAADPSAAQACP